jgi:hypothetical protein
MAAVALNTFKTIRSNIGINTVGIYTCPVGVSAIVLLAQVTNLTSTTTSQVTAIHSRPSEGGNSDYKFSNGSYVPPNDSVSLVPDGRLALETNDIIKVHASGNNQLNIVLSILETAKQ